MKKAIPAPVTVDGEYIDVPQGSVGGGHTYPSAVFKKIVHPAQKTWVDVIVAAMSLTVIVGLELLLNYAGWQWLNVIPLVLVSFLIVAKGYSPKIIFWAIGLGGISGLIDGDDATTAGDGVERGFKILHRTVMSILFAFWFASMLLTLIPWHQRPEAFVALMGATIFVLILYQAYGIDMNPWVMIILGTSAAVIVALWAFWTTIPNSWQGQVFDKTSGSGIYMMEPDGSHVFTDIHASACKEQACFSPYTGDKLIPVTPDAAKHYGLQSTQSTFGEFFSTFGFIILMLPIGLGFLILKKKV